MVFVYDFIDVYVNLLQSSRHEQLRLIKERFKDRMLQQFAINDIQQFIPIYGTDANVFIASDIFAIKDYIVQIQDDDNRLKMQQFFDSSQFRRWAQCYDRLQQEITSACNEVKTQKFGYFCHII